MQLLIHSIAKVFVKVFSNKSLWMMFVFSVSLISVWAKLSTIFLFFHREVIESQCVAMLRAI